MDDCTAHLFDMTLGDSDDPEDTEEDGGGEDQLDEEGSPTEEAESLMSHRKPGLSLDVSQRLSEDTLEEDQQTDHRHRDFRYAIPTWDFFIDKCSKYDSWCDFCKVKSGKSPLVLLTKVTAFL